MLVTFLYQVEIFCTCISESGLHNLLTSFVCGVIHISYTHTELCHFIFAKNLFHNFMCKMHETDIFVVFYTRETIILTNMRWFAAFNHL